MWTYLPFWVIEVPKTESMQVSHLWIMNLSCVFFFVGGFWRCCLHFMSNIDTVIYLHLLPFPYQITLKYQYETVLDPIAGVVSSFESFIMYLAFLLLHNYLYLGKAFYFYFYLCKNEIRWKIHAKSTKDAPLILPSQQQGRVQFINDAASRKSIVFWGLTELILNSVSVPDL